MLIHDEILPVWLIPTLKFFYSNQRRRIAGRTRLLLIFSFRNYIVWLRFKLKIVIIISEQSTPKGPDAHIDVSRRMVNSMSSRKRARFIMYNPHFIY